MSGLGTLATLNQVGTGQISDGAVTNAKLANMAAATFKGRAADAGTGDPTDLTAAEAKTALAISASDVSGLGTLATLNQAGTGQISDDAVTNAKLANMAAATFKGRAAGAGTGDPTDLTAAQAKAALAISASDVSGLGALATLSQVGTGQISDDVVTYAKMQNVSAASRLLGRGQAGGAGDPEEIILGSGLSMTGTTLSSESSFPVNDTTTLVQDPVDNTKRARIDAGAIAPSTTRTITMGDRDVDLAAGGTFAELSHTHTLADITNAGALAALNQVGSAQISDDAVTNVKLANMAAATFKGRAAGAGTGDPTDLSAAQAKTALAISSADVSGLGALATLSQVGSAQVADDAVTNVKLANMAAATFKGRAAGAGTGDPTDLSAAQAKTALAISTCGRERARRPGDAQPGRLRADRCRGARRQANQYARRSAAGRRDDRLCRDQRDACDQRGGPYSRSRHRQRFRGRADGERDVAGLCQPADGRPRRFGHADPQAGCHWQPDGGLAELDSLVRRHGAGCHSSRECGGHIRIHNTERRDDLVRISSWEGLCLMPVASLERPIARPTTT